jgi:DNA processing protein
MNDLAGIQFGEHSAEDLIGPLNDVERKFAPERIFVAGDVSILEAPRVAIVGTRRPTSEGVRRAKRLARVLVERGVTVVSGLAAGIDTTAHRTAIESGGRTVAVLGTALSETYPPDNRELQFIIMREHLVVSQFPEKTPIQKKNFPQRNRTMALLSDASVIVEAGEGSGTLSQGWETLRLGRPLFLLQSVIENPSLRWPAEMAEYGAIPLPDPKPLLAALPPSGRSRQSDVAF